MNEPIYELKGVRQRYGDLIALSVEHLAIVAGTIIGLVGPNGSGKSTLLRLLAFIEKPLEGELVFKTSGAKVADRSARLRVTLLDQDPYLLKRSVAENVAYGLKVRGDERDRQLRVNQALSWVGLPAEEFAHRKWYELSGGEAQRVALAARLILKPKVLLLDEPTSSVDAASALLIKEASLRAREEWGTTLIIASHDWSWLHEVCDEMLHVFKGRVTGSGVGNILFGPWINRSDGLAEKVLTGGTRIIVSSPPRDDAVAVLSSSVLSLHLQPLETSRGNALPGRISALALQKRSGKVIVTVSVDSVYFNVDLTQAEIREQRIHPGLQVWVDFTPASVKWV